MQLSSYGSVLQYIIMMAIDIDMAFFISPDLCGGLYPKSASYEIGDSP